MQSFALLTLVKVWRGFDATKYNNPFAYFTQIVHHAFHQLDNQERRQRDIRDAILVDQGKNPSFNYSERMVESDETLDEYSNLDYMEVHDRDITTDTDIQEIMDEITVLQNKSVTDEASIQEENSQIE
jgi:DNA-directed RNA polymerase specialized sigma24 family protein